MLVVVLVGRHNQTVLLPVQLLKLCGASRPGERESGAIQDQELDAAGARSVPMLMRLLVRTDRELRNVGAYGLRHLQDDVGAARSALLPFIEVEGPSVGHEVRPPNPSVGCRG